MTDDPESLTLHLLREIRAEQKATNEHLDKIALEIGDLKSDVKEIRLATALLEVREAQAS
ncbi:MAG: hypothetical protein WAN43_10735 [Rhodomicrobium sp.]